MIEFLNSNCFGKRVLIVAILVLSLSKSGLLLALYDTDTTGNQENTDWNNVEPTCPATGKTNLTFRNLCEMYTVCEEGRLTLETCPDGLYYNKRKKICDLRSNVPDCEPLDKHVPSTARPSRRLVARIKQNFECDPLDIVVKRNGMRRCRVQVVCANGVSFVLRRCMQTISFRV